MRTIDPTKENVILNHLAGLNVVTVKLFL